MVDIVNMNFEPGTFWCILYCSVYWCRFL